MSLTIEEKLHELLPIPITEKSYNPCEPWQSRQIALKILGLNTANEEALQYIKQCITKENLKPFTHFCTFMRADNKNRQWIDALLIGMPFDEPSDLVWMPNSATPNINYSIDTNEVEKERSNVLSNLGSLLHSDLGIDAQYISHKALQVSSNSNALVDIKLGETISHYSNLFKDACTLKSQKLKYSNNDQDPIDAANQLSEEVYQNVSDRINAFISTQKLITVGNVRVNPSTLKEPLVVQILKATAFNRATSNINQLIANTEKSLGVILPLVKFMQEEKFVPLNSDIKSQNKFLLQTFGKDCEYKTNFQRTATETQLQGFRTRAKRVMSQMRKEGHSIKPEWKTEYLLTIIISWLFCKKIQFKPELRQAKDRDMISGKGNYKKAERPAIRAHINQLLLIRDNLPTLMDKHRFHGNWSEDISNVAEHRIKQYNYQLKIIEQLRQLPLTELDKIAPQNLHQY